MKSSKLSACATRPLLTSTFLASRERRAWDLEAPLTCPRALCRVNLRFPIAPLSRGSAFLLQFYICTIIVPLNGKNEAQATSTDGRCGIWDHLIEMDEKEEIFVSLLALQVRLDYLGHAMAALYINSALEEILPNDDRIKKIYE